jgi:hypothetical protein
MPYWSPLIIDGAAVDLSHLEPFEFLVMPTGGTQHATISVRFHDHCFTETFDPAKHDTPIASNQASRHEKRAFDMDRYNLSFALPDAIRSFDGVRFGATRRGNFVRVTLNDGRTYPIFFTLRHEGGRHVALFVVSAYALDRPTQVIETGEMRFNVAIAKLLKGEKLRFPPYR